MLLFSTMDVRFATSSSTCCKMRALMILAMLAVSEGRRLLQMSNHRDQLKSHEAFSSRGAAGNKVSPLLGSDLGAPVDSPMKMLPNDPAFKEQLAAMAEHMDEFVFAMKREASPSLLMQATNMANELCKLSIGSKSSVESSLPEDMESMIADRDFQKHAQAWAAKMKENVKLNIKQDSVEEVSSEQTLKTVSDQVAEVTNDPQFQQTLRRVSEALPSLMQDPEISVQAESLAAYLESVKDSHTHTHFDIAEKLGEQVDAMIANKKLKANASAFVYQMLKAESKDGSEFAADDELVEDLKRTMHKTLKAMEVTTQEFLEAMGSTPDVIEALKVMVLRTDEDKTSEAKGEAHASFLEEWSGQEDDMPLFAVNALFAFKPSEAAAPALLAKGFPGRNRLQETYQPAFGDPLRRLKPSHGIQMKDIGSGAEEKSALQQPKSALTWRGGFTNKAVTVGTPSPKAVTVGTPSPKSVPVDFALRLSLAVWYFLYWANTSNPKIWEAAGGAALLHLLVPLAMSDNFLKFHRDNLLFVEGLFYLVLLKFTPLSDYGPKILAFLHLNDARKAIDQYRLSRGPPIPIKSASRLP